MVDRPILVMGICGVGKSTVAAAIAARIGATFVEADTFHPPENVAAMRAGQPLTDDMRWGWLDRVGAAVAAQPGPTVLACSALSRAHRDRLREQTGPLRIVYLHGERALIETRMSARQNHYMPAVLIDSQLAALQAPDRVAEAAIWLDIAADPDRVIDQAVTALAMPPNPHQAEPKPTEEETR